MTPYDWATDPDVTDADYDSTMVAVYAALAALIVGLAIASVAIAVLA